MLKFKYDEPFDWHIFILRTKYGKQTTIERGLKFKVNLNLPRQTFGVYGHIPSNTT